MLFYILSITHKIAIYKCTHTWTCIYTYLYVYICRYLTITLYCNRYVFAEVVSQK